MRERLAKYRELEGSDASIPISPLRDVSGCIHMTNRSCSSTIWQFAHSLYREIAPDKKRPRGGGSAIKRDAQWQVNFEAVKK